MPIFLSQIATPDIVYLLLERYGLLGAGISILFLFLIWNGRQQRLAMNAQLKSLQRDQALLRQDWVDQKKDIRNQDERIEKLQDEIRRKDLDYMEQAQELSAARNDIEDLKAAGEQKNSAIKLLEKQLDDLQQTMASNQTTAEMLVEEANKRADTEKQRADGLAADVQRLTGLVADQAAEIVLLNETIKTQSGEILALGERVRHLETEKAALVADIDALAEGMNAQPIDDETQKGMN